MLNDNYIPLESIFFVTCNTLNKKKLRVKYVKYVNQKFYFYVEPFCYHSNNEGYNKYIDCTIKMNTRRSDAFHLVTAPCNKPHALIGRSIEDFFFFFFFIITTRFTG